MIAQLLLIAAFFIWGVLGFTFLGSRAAPLPKTFGKALLLSIYYGPIVFIMTVTNFLLLVIDFYRSEQEDNDVDL